MTIDLSFLQVVDTVRDFTNGDVEVNTAVNGRSWVPVACGPRPRTALGHPIIAVAGYYGLVEDSIFYNGKMVSPTGFEIAGGMRQTQSWTKSVRYGRRHHTSAGGGEPHYNNRHPARSVIHIFVDLQGSSPYGFAWDEHGRLACGA